MSVIAPQSCKKKKKKTIKCNGYLGKAEGQIGGEQALFHYMHILLHYGLSQEYSLLCICSSATLFIQPVYNIASLHLLILNSQSFPPPHPGLCDKSVLCI